MPLGERWYQQLAAKVADKQAQDQEREQSFEPQATTINAHSESEIEVEVTDTEQTLPNETLSRKEYLSERFNPVAAEMILANSESMTDSEFVDHVAALESRWRKSNGN